MKGNERINQDAPAPTLDRLHEWFAIEPAFILLRSYYLHISGYSFGCIGRLNYETMAKNLNLSVICCLFSPRMPFNEHVPPPPSTFQPYFQTDYRQKDEC